VRLFRWFSYRFWIENALGRVGKREMDGLGSGRSWLAFQQFETLAGLPFLVGEFSRG